MYMGRGPGLLCTPNGLEGFSRYPIVCCLF